MYLSPRHAMFGLFIASLLSMSTDATNTTNSTSLNTTDSSPPAKVRRHAYTFLPIALPFSHNVKGL